MWPNPSRALGFAIALNQLAAALTVLFFGLLFHVWWLAALGALGTLAAAIAWLRPSRPERMSALNG